MRAPPSVSLPPSLRQRLDALTPRERVFIAVGALAMLAFLIYFLIPGDDAPESEPIEMLPAPAPPSTLPVAPAIPAVTSVPAPAPIAPSSVDGLIVRGVMGGGPAGGAAIIAFPDGRQRVVRIGREFLPGMVLKEVALRHIIVSGGGGDIRLDLNKPGGVAVPAATAGVPAAPAAAASGAASGQGDSLDYRMGLAPRKVRGRTTGFTIRPGANLPLLQRAGLRPGDVLVAVNGQAFESEEKVMELAGEIAGSYTAEFEFDRGGRRMKAALEVNKKPSQ
jgi:general secretion pathway protein C